MPDTQKSQLTERIYTSRAASRNPLKVIPSVFRDFSQARSLGYRLASRNIKAQYRQSFLGIAWAFLPPIATALIWIILNSQNVVKFEGATVPYPVFVLTGTILWQVFTQSITKPLGSVQENRSILSKINFPRESLLVSAFYEISFQTGISMLIVLAALIIFKVSISPFIILGLLGIIALIIMGMTIGLLILPISMLFQDIQRILPFALQFLMYLTPVIYPVQKFTGFGKILEYNPLIPVLESIRSWLFGQPELAIPGMLLILLIITFFFLTIGLVLYRLAMEIIIERIGS
jgi:lipopolysaccharide transport system permease protein